MANNRIFYACQRAEIAPDGSTTPTAIHGLQSLGLNTTIPLNQVSEFGQISLYQNTEDIPNVEISTSRVLDGSPPVYLLATQQASSPSLVGRSNAKCIFHMGVWSDTNSTTAGTSPLNRVEVSGAFVTQLGWEFNTNGPATETCTLVSQSIRWAGGSGAVSLGGITFDSSFASGDSPVSLNSSGGVNRRQHLLMTPSISSPNADRNGQLRDVDCSIFPPSLYGVNSSGVNTLTSSPHAVIQRISVSCNLGREQILELGKFGIYFRYVTFPIECQTEFEILSVSGSMVNFTETGVYASTPGTFCADRYNLQPATIRLATCEGLRLYMGYNNKISSISYNGGSTGGENATQTIQFTNYNDLTVCHYNDPNVALVPNSGFIAPS